MHGERNHQYPGLSVRARAATFVLALIAIVALPAGLASAAPDSDAESYPPDAIVNLIDPFGCAPDSISGEIGAVLAGSSVTLSLTINGEAASSATPTAGADGQIEYTLSVPSDRFGPANVRAEGTDSIGDPFVLDTAGTITDCPVLPKTGGSDMGIWITLGVAAVLAGGILVAVTTRRRRATV